MSNQESSRFIELYVSVLDYPAALVVHLLTAAAILNDQFDFAVTESLAQQIGVVGAAGNEVFRCLPCAAFVARELEDAQHSLSQRDNVELNFERITATADQCHPLSKPTGLFSTNFAFFGEAKPALGNVSSHLVLPAPYSAPSNGRRASKHSSSGAHRHKQRISLQKSGTWRARTAPARRSATPKKCFEDGLMGGT